MATKPSSILPQLHALERNLEAKLRRQEAAVTDTATQLEGVRAMLKASQDL